LESMGERGGPAHRLQAQTDAQGRLALDRLPAGSYRLLAFNAEVGHVSLARDERRSATFKVQAGRRSQIRGRITDTGGAPQPDLPVTLHQASPPRLLAETRTDGDGAYGFRDLPASKLIVRVAPGTAQSTEQRN